MVLLFPIVGYGQAWQKIGGINPKVGVRAQWMIDADSGVLSKGHPVLTGVDIAWIKPYNDSLHHELANGSMTVTGSSTKTITVIKSSGAAWMNASFTDNDNQSLTVIGDSLKISGANTVKMLNSELVYQSTGSTATTYTLPSTPLSNKHVIVTLNTAFVDNVDFTLTGNQLHFNFPIELSDKLKIYYKSQ